MDRSGRHRKNGGPIFPKLPHEYTNGVCHKTIGPEVVPHGCEQSGEAVLKPLVHELREGDFKFMQSRSRGLV